MNAAERTLAGIFSERPSMPVPTRFTDPQLAFIESRAHLTVLWGGNSAGKSIALAEIARRAILGQMPGQRPGRRYVVMLVGNTWTQLGQTIKYFMDGVPDGTFRKGVRYESGGMKGQRLAVFEVVGGPCAGSELRCGTFDAKNLAGPRADYILSDEPLPEPVYNELMPRLLGRNGRMFVTFTPTLGTAGDIGYLWRVVDDPASPWAVEVRAETTVANCTPRGGLIEIPFLRQDEIDRLARGLSPIEVDMRLGRSRMPRMDCGYFDGAWDPTTCRVDWRPPEGTRVLVGTDHGSKANAQVSSLVYAHGYGFSARYHVGGMYMSSGRSEMVDDARGVVEMLWRAGIARPRRDLAGLPLDECLRQRAGNKGPTIDLGDVDLWIGDRSHGGYNGGRGAKSNGDMQRAIAQLLGYDVDTMEAYQWREKLPAPLQRIRQPRKRLRSMWDGMDVMRRMMPGRLTIGTDPSLDPLADAFARWGGALLDPLRDRLDSVRYPVTEVESGRWRPGQ